MDLSKLPRLSGDRAEPAQGAGDAGANPAKPAPAHPADPSDRLEYAVAAPRAVGPEVWLSCVVGLIFIWLGVDFAKWAVATATGHTFDSGVAWTTGPRTGQTVPYWEVLGYRALTDSSLFVFGVACVLEGLVLLVAHAKPSLSRSTVLGSLGMALLATAYNAVVVAVIMKDGGVPLLSLLVIAFGGYMVLSQWHMLRGDAGVR
jgi:hypothetical protein